MFNLPLREEAPVEGIDYELIEVSELAHPTDEAMAVKAQFGPPQITATAAQLAPEHMPLVVIGYDQRRVLQIVDRQRSAANGALRPIGVVGIRPEDASPTLQELVDGIPGPGTSIDALRGMGERLQGISTVITTLRPDHDDRALLLLQYLYSRERGPIVPIIDPAAQFAYRYPLAERLLSASSAQALDVLEDLAEYRLLTGKVVDRLFLCPHCSGYRVPVKELCPECHTPDISTQDSIHHFRCGFIGPESEFIADGRLKCPKCRAHLRHIGVEYNRPGRVVTCHGCGHWSSEPQLRAWCLDCDRYLAPEQLKSLRIRRFAITSRGLRAARAGRWTPDPAQLVSPAPGINADSARTSGATRRREVARAVLRVATANQWAIAAYKVELDDPAKARRTAGQENDGGSRIEQCITQYLGPQALIAPVGTKSIVVLNPGDQLSSASKSAALGKQITKRMRRRAQVSVLSASAAAELLLQAS